MNFDRLAPHYDWMESVLAGRKLQRARTAWLDALSDCECLLSVGEGHGRFACACAANFPKMKITCVDASGGMLARAKRRAEANELGASRIEWIQVPVREANLPAGVFDAIVTHFFFDCFPPDELAAVVNSLARAAAPEATWLVADFTIPPPGLARWRARAIHALMYAFFRMAVNLPARRLTPPDELLAGHGFRLAHRLKMEWGLIHSDLWIRPTVGIVG